VNEEIESSLSAESGGTPGIDEKSLTDWLCQQFGDLVAPLDFTRVGEGQSALSFRIEDQAGRRLVLRRPPIGRILESSHDMVREHHILSSLQDATHKTPRILGLCEDLSVTGAPFYLMECVDGLTLNRLEVARGLETRARATTGRSLVTSLVELQAVDIDGCGLGDLRRSASFIERQVRRWTRQWNAQNSRELALIEELGQSLAAQIPQELETVLVHGDYGLHNVLVGSDGEVRAVLDWELCSVGDPLADVSQMIVYWTESGAPAREPNSVFTEPVTELEGFMTANDLASAYAKASGRDLSELGYWTAFAYWKTAIIVEGVYSRWLENPTNGMGAENVAGAVPRLAELAHDALRNGE